jgi:hypothetical protein
MKATAWPAIVVAISLALARDGKRAAAVMTAVSLAVVAVLVGPFAVLRPHSLAKNTILFPLGLASVTSQAVSPLPGHLIAQTGHAGRLFVIALLVASGVAVLASLVIRPPQSVPAAAIRLVIGLTLMFVLAPATRFGYFIYPGGILAWLIVSSAGQRAPTGDRDVIPPGRAGGRGGSAPVIRSGSEVGGHVRPGNRSVAGRPASGGCTDERPTTRSSRRRGRSARAQRVNGRWPRVAAIRRAL